MWLLGCYCLLPHWVLLLSWLQARKRSLWPCQCHPLVSKFLPSSLTRQPSCNWLKYINHFPYLLMTENGDQLWKFNFNFMSLCRYFVVALSVAVAHSFITTLVSLSSDGEAGFPETGVAPFSILWRGDAGTCRFSNGSIKRCCVYRIEGKQSHGVVRDMLCLRQVLSSYRSCVSGCIGCFHSSCAALCPVYLLSLQKGSWFEIPVIQGCTLCVNLIV